MFSFPNSRNRSIHAHLAGGSTTHKVTTSKIASSASPPEKITQNRMYQEVSPSPIPPIITQPVYTQLAGHHHHSEAQLPALGKILTHILQMCGNIKFHICKIQLNFLALQIQSHFANAR
jgi:hypothetical protein